MFDTGAGQTLLANAEVLGVDFCLLNAVVLSHGHYDHTGGLKDVLEKTIQFLFMLIRMFLIVNIEYVGKALNILGLPGHRNSYEMRARLHQKEPVDLGGGLLLTGQGTRLEESEKQERYFFEKQAKILWKIHLMTTRPLW